MRRILGEAVARSPPLQRLSIRIILIYIGAPSGRASVVREGSYRARISRSATSPSALMVQATQSRSRVADKASAKLGGIAVAIALHALAIALLLQLEPLRSAPTQPTPIMVRLVAPAPKLALSEESSKPRPVQPPAVRPKPVPKPVVRPVPKPVVRPAPKPKRAPKPMVRPVPRPAVIPTPQPSVMTAPPEAPSSIAAPAPLPAPVLEAPPEPVAAAPAAPPAPPPIPATPTPAPIRPPSFNADYLNNPAPRYPALSRRMGEEGKVLLRVFVNEEGLPAQVQIQSSSGSSRLDSTALEAVKQWKFVPAHRGAEPVAAWVIVPISFSLRS
jgi:periplasmic protein TonB